MIMLMVNPEFRKRSNRRRCRCHFRRKKKNTMNHVIRISVAAVSDNTDVTVNTLMNMPTPRRQRRRLSSRGGKIMKPPPNMCHHKIPGDNQQRRKRFWNRERFHSHQKAENETNRRRHAHHRRERDCVGEGNAKEEEEKISRHDKAPEQANVKNRLDWRMRHRREDRVVGRCWRRIRNGVNRSRLEEVDGVLFLLGWTASSAQCCCC